MNEPDIKNTKSQESGHRGEWQGLWAGRVKGTNTTRLASLLRVHSRAPLTSITKGQKRVGGSARVGVDHLWMGTALSQ